jgi:ribonuclease BN (tRNA processing enzyme)
MADGIRVLGSGDAFASGGRFNTCILIEVAGRRALVDCGASSLIALRRAGIAPDSLDAILLSHLHGDHFAGVPFLLLDSRYNAPRSRPWLIGGPAGVANRVLETLDLLFPGAAQATRHRVPMTFTEWTDHVEAAVGWLRVTPVPVLHPSGATSYGLRIRCAGRVIAYSGDTGWTESLIDLAQDSDLFLCECYTFDRNVPYHLNYRRLREKQSLLRTRRLVLTHMSSEMLDRAGDVDAECAFDGMQIDL